jgi:hypothetical protein
MAEEILRRDNCGTCRFWDYEELSGEDRNYGMCRRRSPVLVLNQIDPEINKSEPSRCDEACWPISRSYDWCGDWKDGTLKTDIPLNQKYPAFLDTLSARLRGVLGKNKITSFDLLYEIKSPYYLNGCGYSCGKELIDKMRSFSMTIPIEWNM